MIDGCRQYVKIWFSHLILFNDFYQSKRYISKQILYNNQRKLNFGCLCCQVCYVLRNVLCTTTSYIRAIFLMDIGFVLSYNSNHAFFGGGAEGAECYFLVFGKKYLTLYLSKSRKNKFAGIIRQRCRLYLSSFNPRKPQEAEAYLRPHQISSWSFFIKIVGNIFFKSIRNYYYIITIEIFWNY